MKVYGEKVGVRVPSTGPRSRERGLEFGHFLLDSVLVWP
jgi:hypothetical protein